MISRLLSLLILLWPVLGHSAQQYEIMPGKYLIEAIVSDDGEEYPVTIAFSVKDTGIFTSGKIKYPTYDCRARVKVGKQDGLTLTLYEEMVPGFDTCIASRYQLTVNKNSFFTPEKKSYYSILTFDEEEALPVRQVKYSYKPTQYGIFRVKVKNDNIGNIANITDSALLRKVLQKTSEKKLLTAIHGYLDQLVVIEKDMFKKSMASSDIATLENYVRTYPGSTYIAKVNIELKRLKTEKQIRDFRKSGTPDSFYQAYLLSSSKQDVIAAIRAYSTIQELEAFTDNKPELYSHHIVREKLAGWYRQRNTFKDYVQAHRLVHNREDMIKAATIVKNSSSPVKIKPDTLEYMYKSSVHNVSDIENFLAIINNTQNPPLHHYYVMMLSLPGFDQLSLSSFIDSQQYRLVLKHLKPSMKMLTDEKKAKLIITYANKDIALPFSTTCKYDRQTSKVTKTSTLEYFFLGRARQKRLYYNVDLCKPAEEAGKKIKKLQEVLATRVVPYLATWEVKEYSYHELFDYAPADQHQYDDSTSLTDSSKSSSSTPSSLSTKNNSQSVRGVKRMVSNGKIRGASSFRVECLTGSDYIIYYMDGSWFRGDIGHMGNRYNDWSKERLAGSLCE